MSLSDAQLLCAIAASWAGPRTVLKAGHSNTAVSVYSAAYAWGSWLRYSRTNAAFNESMPAVASTADDRTGGRQARPTMQRKTTATLAEARRVVVMRCLVLGWSQSLALALLCHEAFREVDPLFKLAEPLRQLIELVQAALKILQRLALGGVHHPGLA